MEWIWVIGHHFLLACHSFQLDVDNNIPLMNSNDSLSSVQTLVRS
jgi:hypothetical protein